MNIVNGSRMVGGVLVRGSHPRSRLPLTISALGSSDSWSHKLQNASQTIFVRHTNHWAEQQGLAKSDRGPGGPQHKPTFKFNSQQEEGWRETWKKVRPKGHSTLENEVRFGKLDDRVKSYADDARRTSFDKLQSLRDRLKAHGASRETKPYQPPEDALPRLQGIYLEFYGPEKAAQWLDQPINDRITKYKVLLRCQKEFGHEVGNCDLHRISGFKDVVEYYLTPVRGINPYDKLVSEGDKLPGNLYVIPEPIRYNKETDTMFGGISAYPSSGLKVEGLRARKKYPT